MVHFVEDVGVLGECSMGLLHARTNMRLMASRWHKGIKAQCAALLVGMLLPYGRWSVVHESQEWLACSQIWWYPSAADCLGCVTVRCPADARYASLGKSHVFDPGFESVFWL
jgi:hypothetical protein